MTIAAEPRPTGPAPAPAAAARRRLEELSARAAADGDELTAAIASNVPQPLSAYGRWFLRQTAPRLMLGGLALAVVGRLRAGRLRRSDLVIPLSILAAEPFTEWLIHVHILHRQPTTVAGRTLDLHAAAKHREHHLDPADPYKVFVPLPDLLGLVVLASGLGLLLNRTAQKRLTAAVTALAMLCTYEWTHYLIHTPYKPKSRYYRGIWRSHRLHHYKNEHYWMGVTTNVGDRVLGTFPEKSAVATSPTAWTLGVEPA